MQNLDYRPTRIISQSDYRHDFLLWTFTESVVDAHIHSNSKLVLLINKKIGELAYILKCKYEGKEYTEPIQVGCTQPTEQQLTPRVHKTTYR